jgi:hypothetical protein
MFIVAHLIPAISTKSCCGTSSIVNLVPVNFSTVGIGISYLVAESSVSLAVILVP